MALETIYYIGQTVAALAIIASLGFVGVQIRQNTVQAEQANLLARVQVTAELRNSFNDLFRRILPDHELTAALMTLEDHTAPVDEKYIPQLATLSFNLMGISRQAYDAVQNGLIEAWALRDIDQQLFHLISHPRFHALYRAMVGRVDTQTVTEMDRAWVRHINAGLERYRSGVGSGPYALANAKFAPTTSTSRPGSP